MNFHIVSILEPKITSAIILCEIQYVDSYIVWIIDWSISFIESSTSFEMEVTIFLSCILEQELFVHLVTQIELQDMWQYIV